MYKSIFTNEINNKIIVKIKNTKDIGTNYKSKEMFKFDAVDLQLIGPTSVMSNTITYKEAEEIYRGLGKFLKKNKMKILKKYKKS